MFEPSGFPPIPLNDREERLLFVQVTAVDVLVLGIASFLLSERWILEIQLILAGLTLLSGIGLTGYVLYRINQYPPLKF